MNKYIYKLTKYWIFFYLYFLNIKLQNITKYFDRLVIKLFDRVGEARGWAEAARPWALLVAVLVVAARGGAGAARAWALLAAVLVVAARGGAGAARAWTLLVAGLVVVVLVVAAHGGAAAARGGAVAALSGAT